MKSSIRKKISLFVGAGLLIFVLQANVLAQGIYLPTAGPANRGMGGASTAAPTDAMGALYWNPATISGLKQSEIGFGTDLIFPDFSVSSTFAGFSGTTDSDIEFSPAVNVGWVHKLNETTTLGLSVNSVAGFSVNLPFDPTNPVSGVLGQVYSDAQFIQIAPVISVAVTDQLSIAAGPTATMGRIALDPFIFAAPNATGFADGSNSRHFWGGGFQVGTYYIHNSDWRFGLSYKSESDFEDFEFQSIDSFGLPRQISTSLNLPSIISGGVSYNGLENVLLAMDVRYFDYESAAGFGGPAAFQPTGAVGGLGWKSIFSIAAGAELLMTENWKMRFGYTFNENPIPDEATFFNAASPLFYQHMASVGTSLKLSQNTEFSMAYSYAFDNSISGDAPLGLAAPLTVTNDLSVHAVSLGITVKH